MMYKHITKFEENAKPLIVKYVTASSSIAKDGDH